MCSMMMIDLIVTCDVRDDGRWDGCMWAAVRFFKLRAWNSWIFNFPATLERGKMATQLCWVILGHFGSLWPILNLFLCRFIGSMSVMIYDTWRCEKWRGKPVIGSRGKTEIGWRGKPETGDRVIFVLDHCTFKYYNKGNKSLIVKDCV
jgi:hypothetical protein